MKRRILAGLAVLVVLAAVLVVGPPDVADCDWVGLAVWFNDCVEGVSCISACKTLWVFGGFTLTVAISLKFPPPLFVSLTMSRLAYQTAANAR